MKRLRCFLAAAGLVCTSASPALAEGFALYEWSARGIALGGATVARKADPSAVASNPALLTQLKGIHVMGGASSITPAGEMRTTDAAGTKETTSLKPSTWVVPHLYYTQQINDRWYFGIGEFSRFGLGFEYPHDWPGRFNIYEVSLTSASLNPNIAWKATDKLSLAAGVEMLYVNLDLKKRAQVNLTPADSFEVDSNIQDANDAGFGFNLAGHYQFDDQWALGLLYRSQVQVKAHGDEEWTYMGYNGPSGLGSTAQNIYNSRFHDGGAHATVVLPDSIAAGLSYSPIPELSLEAGTVWTRWSTFRGLNIHLPDDQVSYNPKHWRDSWRFNFGAEWEALDWLTLRAGYVWDQSPMTEEYADYLIPTDGRSIYSGGVGLCWQDWTFDLAYAYVDATGRSYDANPETHVLDSHAEESSTHVLSLSIGYKF